METKKLHTKKDADSVLELIQENISKESTLIGGFGKGKKNISP
jgi:hypothetical protein